MFFGDLQQGSQGSDVSELQQHLETLGYSVGSAGVDGVYGPDTAAAVRSFQQDHGLAADGIYGPLTTAAMAAALTNPSGNGTTAPASPEYGPANPLVGPPAAGTGSTLPGGPTQAPLTTSGGSIMDFFKSPVGLGALAVGGFLMVQGDSKGSGSRRRSSRRSSSSRSRRRRR